MRQRRRALFGSITVFVVLGVIGAALFLRPPQFHPYLVFSAPQSLQIALLKNSQPSRAQCEATIGRMARALEKCSTCQLVELRCVAELDARQRKILHGQPVDVPVMRIPDGAVAFFGATEEVALLTCAEGARQTSRSVAGGTECKSPGAESIALSMGKLGAKATNPLPRLSIVLALLLLAAAISFLVCYALIRSDALHRRFSHDHVDRRPQKFHAVPTPRIGGLAVGAALIGTILLAGAFGWIRSTAAEGLYLLTLAAIPAFAGGFGEDLTKRVGVLARLLFTMVAGVMAALLVDATLDRLDVPGLDTLLRWEVFAILFTAFAVGGVANAINIVDGYNGLVGGYAILVLGALALIAAHVGDPVVLSASLVMAGALAGFLSWNYPGGRIFLGDGGSYLLGFWLAELSVLLVARNPDVSPWFPLALLAYPIFETLFSIYRRKILRGESPGHSDALHLHQLVYLRLARVAVGSRNPVDITRRNSKVARYAWAGTSIFIIPAVLFWRNTSVLFGLSMLFAVAYIWLYLRLIRWRAPAWMIFKASTPANPAP